MILSHNIKKNQIIPIGGLLSYPIYTPYECCILVDPKTNREKSRPRDTQENPTEEEDEKKNPKITYSHLFYY